MKAKDFMVTAIPVVTESASLQDVAAVLAEHEVGAVLVVDRAGEVVGIVSEKVLERVLERITEGQDDSGPEAEVSSPAISA